MGIREVAKRAKVSTATVSRTMNAATSVDPETAERVWKAIRELNYYPYLQARSLVSGRSRIFGLIVSDITNPFFPELVKGFEDVAVLNGYEVMVSSTNYDSARMALAVRRMLERKVEGVGIMTSELEPALINELVSREVPTVFLDVGEVHHLMSNIRLDYASGIHLAVDHLLGLGHSRIGFISGPLRLKSARVRRSAFLDYLTHAGILEDDELVTEGDHTVDGGLNAMARLLELPDPPTAILASNDLTAMGAMSAVRRHGWSVPKDVSVIGFDDIHFAEFFEPPLTTIRVSRRDLGETAFRALLNHNQPDVEGAGAHGVDYPLATTFVVRSSTAVARDQGKA
jgi:DNA-binding LacI/PurR family transcriptional regulator